MLPKYHMQQLLPLCKIPPLRLCFLFIQVFTAHESLLVQICQYLTPKQILLSLSLVSPVLNRKINKNQQITMTILRMRVKQLKMRERKIQFGVPVPVYNSGSRLGLTGNSRSMLGVRGIGIADLGRIFLWGSKWEEEKMLDGELVWGIQDTINPFTLPPYLGEEVLKQQRRKEDQIQKQIQRILQEAKKLKGTQFNRKKEWVRWKAGKKIQSLTNLSQNSRSKSMSNKPNQKNQISQNKQNQIMTRKPTVQEKMKAIAEAQKFFQINMQIKKQLIQQTKNTKNQIEAIRNRHFTEELLGQSLNQSNFYSKYQKQKSNPKNNQKIINSLNPKPQSSDSHSHKSHKSHQSRELSPETDNQFYKAWSPQIKKRAMQKIFPNPASPSISLSVALPKPLQIIPLIKNDIKERIEQSGIIGRFGMYLGIGEYGAERLQYQYQYQYQYRRGRSKSEDFGSNQ